MWRLKHWAEQISKSQGIKGSVGAETQAPNIKNIVQCFPKFSVILGVGRQEKSMKTEKPLQVPLETQFLRKKGLLEYT